MVHRRMDRWVDGWLCDQLNGWMKGCMDRWQDRLTDGVRLSPCRAPAARCSRAGAAAEVTALIRICVYSMYFITRSSVYSKRAREGPVFTLPLGKHGSQGLASPPEDDTAWIRLPLPHCWHSMLPVAGEQRPYARACHPLAAPPDFPSALPVYPTAAMVQTGTIPEKQLA